MYYCALGVPERRLRKQTGLYWPFEEKCEMILNQTIMWPLCLPLSEGKSLLFSAPLTATTHSVPAEEAKLPDRSKSCPRGAGSGVPKVAGF